MSNKNPCCESDFAPFLEKAETAIGDRHKPGRNSSRHRIGRHT